MFFRYMKRRCEFLDNLPAFNYNNGGGEYVKDDQGRYTCTNTKQLGSTLMRTMLKEVSDFCDPAIKANWSSQPHQQVTEYHQNANYAYSLIVRFKVYAYRP